MMERQIEDKIPRWLIYGFVSLLGITFATILVSVAWDNSIQTKEREIRFELTSLKQQVANNVLLSMNAVNTLSAYIQARENISRKEFDSYTRELLEYHPFIENIAFFEYRPPDREVNPHINGTGQPDSFKVLHETARNSRIFIPDNNLENDEVFRKIVFNLMYTDAPSTITAAQNIDKKLLFGFFRILFNPITSEISGIVAVYIDPHKYFSNIPVSPDISLDLYNEYPNIGRQLLFKSRVNIDDSDDWKISELTEQEAIQFPASSVKLFVNKHLYWSDFEKTAVYVSLLIGIGVTLFLISLIRSKDIQARELRERNIVIEKKVAEQTMELANARDEAVQASMMKSEFLASMSHEIRTPLNAIIGMSELLSGTALTDEQKKYINVFRRAGDTLLSLVNDILDLSKIEARQLKLEEIPFSINAVIEESVEIYALKGAEKNIELVSYMDQGLNPNRIGDPGRLRQIIINLISNSLKFTEQGEIVVSATDARDADEQNLVLFSVSDTGIGIARDKLNAIFESFTQADSSTTRKYGGTGLGLTICKRLVELMHGRIWVESEPNKGSTFYFLARFPVNEEHAVSKVLYRDIKDKQILLVVHNHAVRSQINEILSSYDVKNTLAADGKEALELYQKFMQDGQGFDLVITDDVFSDMTGFELLKKITELDTSAKTMMMISPVALHEHMKRVKQQGIDSYIVKPVKHQELIKLVNGVFAEVEITNAQEYEPDTREVVIAGKRLLLVDDNQDNRMLIKAYLKKSGLEIDQAENGQEAVDLYQKNEYDLILMDVQMPVMDGHEATRLIRSWESLEQLKPVTIIALTAHATREEIDKCLKSGCTSHLAKPVKKDVLLDTLYSYFRRR